MRQTTGFSPIWAILAISALQNTKTEPGKLSKSGHFAQNPLAGHFECNGNVTPTTDYFEIVTGSIDWN
jgi:hypothetical protein